MNPALRGFLAAVGAVVCFVVASHRGRWGWRLGAVLASVPSVWSHMCSCGIAC